MAASGEERGILEFASSIDWRRRKWKLVRRNVQWRLLLLLDADDHLFQGPVVRNSFYSENLLYACAYTDPESHGNTEPYGNTYPSSSNAETDPSETDSYADSDTKCNAYSYADGVSYGHTNGNTNGNADPDGYAYA